MTDKRRIVVNTLANGSAQAVNIIATLVFMPLLIHSFGKADYGTFLIVTSIAGWASLLDFGVGASLVKMIAQHVAEKDRARIGDLVSAGLVFYVAIGVVASASLIALAFFGGEIFKVTPQGAILLRNLLLVAAGFALVTWPANTAVYVLGGFQRYTITARVQLGVTLTTVCAYIVVLQMHWGPLALFTATSTIMFTGSIVNIFAARRQLAGARVSPFNAKLVHLSHIFSFSWAIFLMQLSTIIVFQNADRLVLGIFLGMAAVALYQPAAQFQSLIVQLVAFTNSAVMPFASHLHASQAAEKLRLLFLRGTKYTLVFVTPVIVVLMVLARAILGRWVGPEFALQASNARILLLPQLLIVGGVIGDSIITGQGKLPKRLPYSLAMTAGNLFLSIVLVQRLGILGVVLGTAIPYLIDYPIHMWWLLRELDVPARRWFGEVVAPVYPLLAVPALLSAGALLTPLSRTLTGLGAAGVVSVGAYYVVVFAFGLDSDERAEVGALAAALRGRFSSAA